MRRFLQEYSQSGVSVKSFCESHSLSLHQYHYWRKRLGFNFRGKGKSRTGSFMKLDITGISGSSGYELTYPGGIKLRLPHKFDATSLSRLHAVLLSGS